MVHFMESKGVVAPPALGSGPGPAIPPHERPARPVYGNRRITPLDFVGREPAPEPLARRSLGALKVGQPDPSLEFGHVRAVGLRHASEKVVQVPQGGRLVRVRYRSPSWAACACLAPVERAVTDHAEMPGS